MGRDCWCDLVASLGCAARDAATVCEICTAQHKDMSVRDALSSVLLACTVACMLQIRGSSPLLPFELLVTVLQDRGARDVQSSVSLACIVACYASGTCLLVTFAVFLLLFTNPLTEPAIWRWLRYR